MDHAALAGSLGGLGITKEKATKSHSYIRKEFDAVAEKLEKHSGDFLVGDQFSIADISFAALSAPVLVVQPWEGFGGYLPPVAELPEDMRDIVTELRAHPAGMFAMRMFRRHRGERQIPGEPAIETAPAHDVYASPDDDERGSGRLGPGVAYKPDDTTRGPKT